MLLFSFVVQKVTIIYQCVLNVSSHRDSTFILQSLRPPFNLCTSWEEIYFRDVFSLFLPDSPSTVFSYFDAFLPHDLSEIFSLPSSESLALYNPHIQSHYPESSPQGLASYLEVTLMTETKFLISNEGNLRRHFVRFSLHRVLAITCDGAIFSKNSTFVFFDGANATTENGI